MLLRDLTVRETNLFSYVIASADMRYSAVNERSVYLRNTPAGPVIRGEISGLDSRCNADLSQVLLEFSLSCEACQQLDKAAGIVDCTAHRLGRVLARKLFQDLPHIPVIDQISLASEFVFQSADTKYHFESTPVSITYRLTGCPLWAKAPRIGIAPVIMIARQGFITLYSSMINTIAPNWTTTAPIDYPVEPSFLEITLQQKIRPMMDIGNGKLNGVF